MGVARECGARNRLEGERGRGKGEEGNINEKRKVMRRVTRQRFKNNLLHDRTDKRRVYGYIGGLGMTRNLGNESAYRMNIELRYPSVRL